MGSAELLTGVPFFRDLDKEELEKIAEIMKEINFPESTVVIEDGSTGSSIYIVKEGAAKVTKLLDDDKEETLAVLNEGECFGEMSLFDHRPRSATVKVEAGSKLYEIPGDAFEKFLTDNKDVALKVYKHATLMLCQRLREANQILVYSRLILYSRRKS